MNTNYSKLEELAEKNIQAEGMLDKIKERELKIKRKAKIKTALKLSLIGIASAGIIGYAASKAPDVGSYVSNCVQNACEDIINQIYKTPMR